MSQLDPRSFIRDWGTHYMKNAHMGATALATTYFHRCLLKIYKSEDITKESMFTLFGLYTDENSHEHGQSSLDQRFRQSSRSELKLLGGDSLHYSMMDPRKVFLNNADTIKCVIPLDLF